MVVKSDQSLWTEIEPNIGRYVTLQRSRGRVWPVRRHALGRQARPSFASPRSLCMLSLSLPGLSEPAGACLYTRLRCYTVIGSDS